MELAPELATKLVSELVFELAPELISELIFELAPELVPELNSELVPALEPELGFKIHRTMAISHCPLQQDSPVEQALHNPLIPSKPIGQASSFGSTHHPYLQA